MRKLVMEELYSVGGGSSEHLSQVDPACFIASVYLAVSPLGGPWNVAGAAVNAINACLLDEKAAQANQAGTNYN